MDMYFVFYVRPGGLCSSACCSIPIRSHGLFVGVNEIGSDTTFNFFLYTQLKDVRILQCMFIFVCQVRLPLTLGRLKLDRHFLRSQNRCWQVFHAATELAQIWGISHVCMGKGRELRIYAECVSVRDEKRKAVRDQCDLVKGETRAVLVECTRGVYFKFIWIGSIQAGIHRTEFK